MKLVFLVGCRAKCENGGSDRCTECLTAHVVVWTGGNLVTGFQKEGFKTALDHEDGDNVLLRNVCKHTYTDKWTRRHVPEYLEY